MMSGMKQPYNSNSRRSGTQAIKQTIFMWVVRIVYWIETVFKGPIKSTELATMLDKEVRGVAAKSKWARVKRIAYKRELNAYVVALDNWESREREDPVVDYKIISTYLEEFIDFAGAQTFCPGAMINTELLLLYCLIRHVKPEIFIESGTKNGYSAVFIAEALFKNDTKGECMVCRCSTVMNEITQKRA